MLGLFKKKNRLEIRQDKSLGVFYVQQHKEVLYVGNSQEGEQYAQYYSQDIDVLARAK